MAHLYLKSHGSLWVPKKRTKWVDIWIKHVPNGMIWMSTLYAYSLQPRLIKQHCSEYEGITVIVAFQYSWLIFKISWVLMSSKNTIHHTILTLYHPFLYSEKPRVHTIRFMRPCVSCDSRIICGCYWKLQTMLFMRLVFYYINQLLW